jgi:outer membrane autotransporter protein
LLAAPKVPSQRPWNVYFGPLGSIGDVSSRSHQPGLDYWSAGTLAGFDYAWSQVGMGVALEYERIAGHAKEDWGHFHLDHAHASLYATYAPRPLPNLSISSIVGGGYEWYHLSRNTGTYSVHQVAQGAPKGEEFDAWIGVEYALWKPGKLQLTPMATLQYVFARMDSYKEHGSPLYDLKMGNQQAKSLRSLLGAQFHYRLDWTNFSFTTQIDGGWQREYLDHDRLVSFVPIHVAGSASSIEVIGAGRNTALAGIDLLFTLYKRFDIDVSYDFECNSLFQDHFFYLGCNLRF